MPYVVTSNCNGCRFTDCIDVCPVDCFYADDQMVYIHPDECIECGACEPSCPVSAIYPEEEVPEDEEKWIALNAEKCESGDAENITEPTDPLPGADDRKAELGF